MKQFLALTIGLVLGFLAFPLAADISQLTGEQYIFFTVPSYGATEAFVGHCTKDITKNGHEWVFVRRDYFGCSKLNVAISDALYGEYTHTPTAEEIEELAAFNRTHNE